MSKSKLFTLVGLVALALVVLAACAAPTPAAKPTDAPQATAAPTQETLKLGAAISMSGGLVKEGGYLKDGYELWKDKVNAAGGLKIGGKSYKIDIKYYDDKSDAETAVKLVDKLVTEDGIKFILGPMGSGISNATSAAGEKYKVLSLLAMANADSIYQRGFKYTFGILPLASSQARPALELTKAKGAKTVAIVTPDDLWPRTVAEGAQKLAKEIGLEVVYFEAYPKGANDLSTMINQMKAKNPDSVVGTGYINELILMTRQMKELQFNPKVVTFSGATTFPDYVSSLGKDTDGVLGLDWWTPTIKWKGGLFGDATNYAKEFKAKFNYEPGYNMSASSAMGEILGMAMEKAGSLEVEKVREALLQIDTEIFFGKVKFDERGANVKGSSAARQIVDGKFIVVWPQEVKEADAIFPKPNWGQAPAK